MISLDSLQPETEMECEVAEWAKFEASRYGGDLEALFQTLARVGCVSGIVVGLIYLKDTLAFYDRHKTEILDRLTRLLECSGAESESKLFGDKWDTADPEALGKRNRNLLAWFGFEEAARSLAERAGMEFHSDGSDALS